MKVEIRNLGVVEQTEIDLKPLTVFVGPNNTGKTWAAYTLLAILGPHGHRQYSKAYISNKRSKALPPLDMAIEQILDEGNAKIDLVEFANAYGETYFNNVAHLSPNWMREFMGTTRISFENLEVQINLAETKDTFLKQIKAYSVEKQLSVDQQSKIALLNALKEQDEPVLFFYTTTEGSVSEKLPPRAVKKFIVETTFEILHRALFLEMPIFPTERTVYSNMPVVELLSISKEVKQAIDIIQANKSPVIRLTGPISLFLEMVTLYTLQSSQLTREEQAKHTPAIQIYIQLAKLLEDEILDGKVDFSTPELHPQRELHFRPTKNIKLEIPLVSSMVKELTPLVLYLRYLAKPSGQLLIIDEPEMNLHPEAQARLIEFLAMLIDAGLHVLFTTHSPYMVDHLVNLMKAAEHDDKDKIKDLFYLKRTEAFIPKEKVSVYLFENGTAKSILDEEGMIDWGTFGNISDEIAQIYFDL